MICNSDRSFFGRRAVLFFFFLLISFGGWAQQIITLDEHIPYQRIGQSIYYLKDPNRQFSFADVSGPAMEESYTKSTQLAPNHGNIDMAVWNKFTICNPTKVHWLLLVESYSVDTLDFYYPDTLTGQYKMERSGRHLPFRTRKYKSNDYAFNLPLAPGDTATFYLKVDSYYMQYPLAVSTQEQFFEESHLKDLLTGIYYGLVIVFMIYNFFVFLNVNDKNYLYYIAYVFFNALLIAQLKGLTAELFGDRLHFLWKYAPAIIGVTSIVNFIFTRHILETKKNVPKWDKIISWVYFPNYIIIILLSVAGFNLYASVLNQLSGLTALFFLLSMAIIIYRKGFKPARFYIIACFFYFVGVLLFTVKGMNLLPFNIITNNAIEFGSTLQMIMFSFVIADRLKIFKREKETAQVNLIASLKENEQLILEQKNMLEVKVKERTHELTIERDRSDKLLLNILPFETANELKETGFSKPRYYDQVSVLFTDFKGFTSISEKLSPEHVVSMLDHCFKAFDEIVEKHDVEKVKTIGDSFMAVGGLPVTNTTNAKDVVKVALEFMQFMDTYNEERNRENQSLLEIRIGIHTGSVVAGIVGVKKFQYDIFGDTVNTASRMESSGEPGKINISQATYELLKDDPDLVFVSRGKIEAKGKGEMEMYFVERRI